MLKYKNERNGMGKITTFEINGKVQLSFVQAFIRYIENKINNNNSRISDIEIDQLNLYVQGKEILNSDIDDDIINTLILKCLPYHSYITNNILYNYIAKRCVENNEIKNNFISYIHQIEGYYKIFSFLPILSEKNELSNLIEENLPSLIYSGFYIQDRDKKSSIIKTINYLNSYKDKIPKNIFNSFKYFLLNSILNDDDLNHMVTEYFDDEYITNLIYIGMSYIPLDNHHNSIIQLKYNHQKYLKLLNIYMQKKEYDIPSSISEIIFKYPLHFIEKDANITKSPLFVDSIKKYIKENKKSTPKIDFLIHMIPNFIQKLELFDDNTINDLCSNSALKKHINQSIESKRNTLEIHELVSKIKNKKFIKMMDSNYRKIELQLIKDKPNFSPNYDRKENIFTFLINAITHLQEYPSNNPLSERILNTCIILNDVESDLLINLLTGGDFIKNEYFINKMDLYIQSLLDNKINLKEHLLEIVKSHRKPYTFKIINLLHKLYLKHDLQNECITFIHDYIKIPNYSGKSIEDIICGLKLYNPDDLQRTINILYVENYFNIRQHGLDESFELKVSNEIINKVKSYDMLGLSVKEEGLDDFVTLTDLNIDSKITNSIDFKE